MPYPIGSMHVRDSPLNGVVVLRKSGRGIAYAMFGMGWGVHISPSATNRDRAGGEKGGGC